jgi:hypothetical protein
MAVHTRRWSNLRGPASAIQADARVERRTLRTARDEGPNEDDIAVMEAKGFSFVRRCPVGWSGWYAAVDWWFERGRGR